MSDAQATLRVSRRSGGYRDRVRAYKVMLNGEQIGAIKHGETCVQAVPVGQHELRMKIDWSGSQTESFSVEPGATVEFHCEPNGNVLNIFWQILTRHKWVRLSRSTTP